MTTKVRLRVGDAWDVIGGATRLTIPPGRPRIVAVTPASGSVAVLWDSPNDGGSPITGFTVTVRNAATNAVLASAPVAANITTHTVTGLTNGVTIMATVTATNAIGSTVSRVSAAVTPVSSSAVKPSVADTGVPIGLAGDPRTAEPLTPPLASRVFTQTTGAGLQYKRLIVSADEVFDHIDFDGIQVNVNPGVNVRFVSCHLHYQDAQGLTAMVTAGDTDGATVGSVEFDRCTVNGKTADPYTPVKAMVSTAGALILHNRIINDCNISHVNDGITWNRVDGDTITGNFVHDLSTVKTNGWVKGTTAQPAAGGSLAAGTYYVNVHALTMKVGTSLHFETIPALVSTPVVVAANGAINIAWTPFLPSAGTARVLEGYRVYISTSPSITANTYIEIPASDGTVSSLTYSGATLTTRTVDLPEDVSGYLHPDGMQMGPGYGRNVLISGNNIESIDEAGAPIGSILQLGSFTPKSQPLGPMTIEDNWLDGTSTAFFTTSATADTAPNWGAAANLTIRRNRIGRRYTNVIRSSGFVSAQPHVWADNVWDSTGPSKNGTGPVVNEGDLVP